MEKCNHCWHWQGRVQGYGSVAQHSYNVDICCNCGETNNIYDSFLHNNTDSTVYQEPEHGKFKPANPVARW